MWGGTPSIWSSYFFSVLISSWPGCQLWARSGGVILLPLNTNTGYPHNLSQPFHLPFLYFGALFSLFFWLFWPQIYLSRLENVEKRALGATESGLGSNMNLTTTPLDTHPTHTLFLSHHTPHHHHNVPSPIILHNVGCALLQILDTIYPPLVSCILPWRIHHHMYESITKAPIGSQIHPLWLKAIKRDETPHQLISIDLWGGNEPGPKYCNEVKIDSKVINCSHTL